MMAGESVFTFLVSIVYYMCTYLVIIDCYMRTTDDDCDTMVTASHPQYTAH